MRFLWGDKNLEQTYELKHYDFVVVEELTV